jgi:sugar phosphate isomerase/epimerase
MNHPNHSTAPASQPSSSLADRLAVCSWSLQPEHPDQLISRLQEIGIPRIQIMLDPLREMPALWGNISEQLAAHGIRIISGVFGTVGEDYSTLESIRRTGGLVPDATWDQNWRNIQEIVRIAVRLGLKLVTFHAGFLPHSPSDPDYGKLRDRLARVADLFHGQGIQLGFETGQETAETLNEFLVRLNRTDVGVNFDPANMILYDKGDPIEALGILGPWLKQCHIKDAIRTRTPGTWGEEVVVGQGQVDWPAFFATLDRLGYAGHLAIEREAGNQRVADILSARRHVESVLANR